MNLIIMPYLDCSQLTRAAIKDCLAQSLPSTLLLIDQGSQEAGRALGIEYALKHPGRVWRWVHDPPLPSLSATWNRALTCAWDAGCDEALVVNNDVRVWEGTVAFLRSVQEANNALFVTATGVTAAQYTAYRAFPTLFPVTPAYPLPGPDFSCFLITKECHVRYPFDEHYIPCYVEDLDYHRRLMLGGDGERIFGTGLPFLHVGSGTLSGMEPEKRARKEAQISQGSRAYHLVKWGGSANEECFTVPFTPSSTREGVATQELFARVRNGQPAI